MKEQYSKCTLAKLKMDSNKFKAKLGIDVDLKDMIDRGLIRIAGEKNGELVYETTETGNSYVKAFTQPHQ